MKGEILETLKQIEVKPLGDSMIVCAAGGAGIVGETTGSTLATVFGALGGAAIGAKFEISRQRSYIYGR